MRLKYLHIRALLFICLISSSIVLPAPAQDKDNSSNSAPTGPIRRLDAVCFVTWWVHSAEGYCPAILVRVENASGQDLSGALVNYQARFTDLRDNSVDIARDEIRTSLAPRRQHFVFLKGPRAFKLPIEQSLWPTMECKIMCRVGDDENTDTQTLLISKVAALTMSFDEANMLLSRQPDIRRLMPPAAIPEKPLLAINASSKSDKPKVTLGQSLTPSKTIDKTQAMHRVEEVHRKLTVLEQRLLKADYSTEDISSRLERLENRVFGEQQKGTLTARVQKLETKTTPPPVGSLDKLPRAREELARLETAKFGHKFESEDVIKRLVRLEIKQFGKAGSGKATERLDALLLSE